MMFSNNFILAIKVGGKVLREQGSLVSLPFGCEYTVLLKNLLSRRAMVKVSVDGKDATEQTRLILEPNASLELERFIRNGNNESGNRFKFIERTGSVEAHRGITENDGIVRAEFWAEQVIQDEIITRRHYYDEYCPVPRPYFPPRPRDPWWKYSGPTCSSGPSRSMGARRMSSVPTRSLRPSASSGPRGSSRARVEVERGNDAGITVAGSTSHQQFRSVCGFPLESQSHVITLQLRGEVGGKVVAQAVTVDRKACCDTCGKKNKATLKFCGECGASLVLV